MDGRGKWKVKGGKATSVRRGDYEHTTLLIVYNSLFYQSKLVPMSLRNPIILVAFISVVIFVAAIVVVYNDDSCTVTFKLDYNTEYQTVEVESGTVVIEPSVPSISDTESFYYLAGWKDSYGNSWDFSTPIQDDVVLYADKEKICDTYYLGFDLCLNMYLTNGWSHTILWGDGSTSTYPEDRQPRHEYRIPGTYTITINSTSPSGEIHVSNHIWKPMTDSVGSLVPAIDSRFSFRIIREITDQYGNVQGYGEIHACGHDISRATLGGGDVDQSIIDRMNEIRDLSHARVYSEGVWNYSHSEGGHINFPPGNYEVFRVVYDSSSYDLISEKGWVIAIHVGGDVDLNYDWVSNSWGKWTKL